MRVCVVTEAGYVHGIGGMQEHTSNLVRGLVDAGHEVEVITGPHPEGLAETTHEGATWHFVDAPTTMRRLPMRNPEWHRQVHGPVPRAARAAAVRCRPQRVDERSRSACTAVLHRPVPIVAKFHGNYLAYARETCAARG